MRKLVADAKAHLPDTTAATIQGVYAIANILSQSLMLLYKL